MTFLCALSIERRASGELFTVDLFIWTLLSKVNVPLLNSHRCFKSKASRKVV